MNLIELLGPTAVASIICLIVGFVLLLIEMFTPGVGAAGVSGVIAHRRCVMQFGWGNTRVASYIVAITLLIIILGIIWIIRSLQRGKLSKSFLVLNAQSDGESVPEIKSAKQELIGKSGVTITPLRPSGIAEIDGKRVDVMTAGAFIERGKAVVVIKAEGMHILVRDEAAAAN